MRNIGQVGELHELVFYREYTHHDLEHTLSLDACKVGGRVSWLCLWSGIASTGSIAEADTMNGCVTFMIRRYHRCN